MIPRWKIARELARFGQQLRAFPEAMWGPVVYGRYDRRFPEDLKTHEGQVPLTKSVALLLTYPRPELSESVVNLCESLTRAGQSTLAISNAMLGPKSMARLLPHAWRVVERPNIGHDFGGYRDGIWLLWRWQTDPDTLLILNDRVWLLDNDATALIEKQHGAYGDVSGSILHTRLEERFLEPYRNFIRKAALKSPDFQRYWASLRLTSNKYKVIRRGERGHSAALLAGGLKIAPVFEVARFLAGLAAAPVEKLRQTLEFAAWNSSEQAAALLQGDASAGWRDQPKDLVARAFDSGQFYSMFPVAAQGVLGYLYPETRR